MPIGAGACAASSYLFAIQVVQEFYDKVKMDLFVVKGDDTEPVLLFVGKYFYSLNFTKTRKSYCKHFFFPCFHFFRDHFFF